MELAQAGEAESRPAMALELSNEEYHKHPALGSSDLKTILRKSPAHYFWNKKNPPEPTPAMILGTAIHTAILEPELFKQSYCLMPEFEGTGSRLKKAEWLHENAKKISLKQDDVERIFCIKESIGRHKAASQLLKLGTPEKSYFATIDGLVCKCRPDYLRNHKIIVDLKSTIDASYAGFTKAIASYDYHLSAALYMDVVSQATGEAYTDFICVAVEKTPPYGVGVYRLDDAAVEAGRAEYKTALRKFPLAVDDGRAYPDEVQSISIPAWKWPAYGEGF